MQIHDRIKSFVRVRAGDLKPSPKNWRGNTQEKKLFFVLSSVALATLTSWFVRETQEGLQLIDGHLRASRDSEIFIPAPVLDVTQGKADWFWIGSTSASDSN